MGQVIINVRGWEIAVESKSGSQTKYIKSQLEKRPAHVLKAYADETQKRIDREDTTEFDKEFDICAKLNGEKGDE